jgi:hypothetical protein
MTLDRLIAARALALCASNLSTQGRQAKACPRRNTGQHAAPLLVAGAVPQTTVILVVTRRYSSGLLNFTAHSPEDSQRDRKCRSARLQRTVPKRLLQYITAVHACFVVTACRGGV